LSWQARFVLLLDEVGQPHHLGGVDDGAVEALFAGGRIDDGTKS
jgi:hypothetical protein